MSRACCPQRLKGLVRPHPGCIVSGTSGESSGAVADCLSQQPGDKSALFNNLSQCN